MERSCDVCGTSFEAKRAAARYCSPACRKRAQRIGAARSASVAPSAQAPPLEGDDDGPGVVATTVADLRAADRLCTPQGQVAVKLARMIDTSTAVMGFAALTKEHDRALEKALAGATSVTDPVDELRAKRDSKVAG